MSGPAHRITPAREEFPEEVYQTEPIVKTRPIPQVKHPHNETVHPSSLKGFTLDASIIVDKQSVTIRELFDGGMLLPRSTFVSTQGYLYEAVFLDRPRIVVITKETFEALTTEQSDDSEALPELSIEQQLAVDLGVLPDRIDALKMVEHGPGGTWDKEDPTP